MCKRVSGGSWCVRESQEEVGEVLVTVRWTHGPNVRRHMECKGIS